MPLSPPSPRREIHFRVIDMRAYARDDGLYDVEARLIDRKPFDFKRQLNPRPVPAMEPLHDIWVRLTVDKDFVVRAIEAASDVTPFAICKEAESTLSGLIGERLVRGWSAKVKEKLRGAQSCTHIMEVLIPLATTALQGIRGLRSEDERNPVGADGVPLKIDTCYAYGRQRDVVKILWPEHHRADGLEP
jgi:hypothetical protein